MNSNENENEDFNEKEGNEKERGVEEREYEIPVLQTAESDNSRPVRPMVVISSQELGQGQGRSEQSGDYLDMRRLCWRMIIRFVRLRSLLLMTRCMGSEGSEATPTPQPSDNFGYLEIGG